MTTGDSDSHSSSLEDGDDNAPVINKSYDVDSHSQSPSQWLQLAAASVAVTENGNGLFSQDSMSSMKRLKRLEVETQVIQVANIAPQATRDQMAALFGYVGKTEDVRLYPTMDIGMQYTSKICFVKFRDSAAVGTAQHLTNTVFVDRALIVIPYTDGDIPDEARGLELLNSGSILPGIADPKLPQHVTSQLEGIPPHQVVVTTDPLIVEQHLPPYPNLPPTYDSRRIEEIRRTIMIANLDSEITADDLVDFIGNAGEIKYVRLCTRDNDPLNYALIEFTEQPSVLAALKCNGTKLGSKHIKVFHSTQAIVKPQAKTNEAAQKEIEEAMTRQAHTLISQGLDGSSKEKRRSRSLSRGRHVRSVARRSRSRTRSPPRRRSRSRSRRRRSRSRSPRRVRRSRSRSPGRVLRSPWRRSRERKRSSSRTRRAKRSSSRDKDRKRDKKPKKDKDRDKEKDKGSSSKDRTRDRDVKEKGKENGTKADDEIPKEDKDRDRVRDRDRKREKRKSLSRSPVRDKRHSPSHDKKKRNKSKKKKRESSDREESADDHTSNSRNTSVERDLPIDLE